MAADAIRGPQTGTHNRRRQLVAALVPLALVIFLSVAGALKFLDYKLHDLAFATHSRDAEPGLVLVEIDATSLLALEQWPWPRSHHARALDNLLDAGAHRIAVDIDFSNHSTPAEDQALAEALERADGKVILPAFVQYARGTMGTGTIMSEPIAAFRDHVSMASVNVRPADDGLIRTTTIFENWRSGSIASMAAQLAGVVETTQSYNSYTIDYGIGIGQVPALSFIDVLNGDFDPEVVRGRNVLIGATAVELKDVLPVPLYKAMSGVHLYAVAYQSLIKNRMLQSPAPAITVLILILITALLAPVFDRLSWQRGLILVAATMTAVIALHLLFYAAFPVLFNVAAVLCLTGLLYVSTLLSKVDRQTLMLLLQDLRLGRADAMMRTIVESSFDMILTIDDQHRVVTANAAACRGLGGDANRLVGRRFSDFVPTIASFESSTRDDATDHVSGEARRLDGTTFPVEIAFSRSKDSAHAFHIAVIRNVTKRQEHENLLRHQARHDALTDLPNRLALSEAMDAALAAANSESFALLLLDLDRFKDINDTLGHQTGDRLLVSVAKRIGRHIGEDALFARLGGDEFAILLPPPAAQQDAELVARRISHALEAPFDFNGISLALKASVGVALYPDHASDLPQLLQRADVAMYLSKGTDDCYAVYDAERDLNSVRHLALSGQLSRAIKDKQVRFYYQPKLELRTGRMCGVEALARWDHPELGIVEPSEFIRVAESSGLIKPLTELALRTVVADVADWLRQGVAVGVSVNLPAQSVHDPELPNLIADCLAQHAVDPGGLTLEITETTIMQDPEMAGRTLREIDALGVRLSIDDFGTGYSSLSYLSKLPVSELKIDRSFVMAMAENATDETIVRSTIDLAHNLGLVVVAEGVETAEQRQTLTELGCDIGQGYWFSRPLKPADFIDRARGDGFWQSRFASDCDSGGEARDNEHVGRTLAL